SGQPLSVTAFSSNPAMVPNPTVSYTSPSGVGTLFVTPAADAFGTAMITVIVNDGQGLRNTVTRTFSVTVSPVNDPPTLDAINPVTINEDSGTTTINLSGITSGPANEPAQPRTVTASSSNPAIVPKP